MSSGPEAQFVPSSSTHSKGGRLVPRSDSYSGEGEPRAMTDTGRGWCLAEAGLCDMILSAMSIRANSSSQSLRSPCRLVSVV